MRLETPFIHLPYKFDSQGLAREISLLEDGAWIAHPSNLKGNSAVPLISKNGEVNNDFSGPMAATKNLKRCPYLQQVIASFGEVIGRSRLMKLAAACEVSKHVDFNYHWYKHVRIHIPLISNKEVKFYCGDEVRHMGEGECWIFDSWRPHQVVNGGQKERIHLVIDTCGSAKFWQMLKERQGLSLAEARDSCREIKYREGLGSPLLTEKYTGTAIMSPGEVDALVSEWLDDVESHPGNCPQQVSFYKKRLTDFTRDWRQCWSLYGLEETAREEYRKLIDTVEKSLPENPRALLMGSNGIGFKPVLVQRILRAAILEV